MFYFDKYNSVTLETLNGAKISSIIALGRKNLPKSYQWWSLNYSAFMEIFKHSLSIIIHPHISLTLQKRNKHYKNAAFLCSRNEIKKERKAKMNSLSLKNKKLV